MSPTVNEWCAGMPLVEKRPFSSEERERLEREAKRLRRQGWFVVWLYPVLVAFFALIATQGDTSSSLVQTILTGGAILLFLGLPLIILIARDSFRRSRGLFGDLKAEYIKRFVGPPVADSGENETLHTLLRRRMLSADAAEWNLELLPASGRLWRIMDRPVAKWITVETVEIAETPEFASLAAEWLQPVARSEEGTLLGGERDMSEAERDELRTYAKRLWTRPLPFAIGLTLWFSIPLVMLLLSGDPERKISWFRFIFLGTMTLITDISFALAVRNARLLRQDAEVGRLYILRLESSATPSLSPEVAEKPSALVEKLPFSGWDWTREGKPAGWRMTRPS